MAIEHGEFLFSRSSECRFETRIQASTTDQRGVLIRKIGNKINILTYMNDMEVAGGADLTIPQTLDLIEALHSYIIKLREDTENG